MTALPFVTPEEEGHPDFCPTCEEIHAERCPMEPEPGWCEGCGRKNCECDWDED